MKPRDTRARAVSEAYQHGVMIPAGPPLVRPGESAVDRPSDTRPVEAIPRGSPLCRAVRIRMSPESPDTVDVIVTLQHGRVLLWLAAWARTQACAPTR
jgi:hypothetical protein